jgi:hypothetical protein
MIIGAGVGALGSAAMGKSPFTGALMGGALGGLGGAGGLFGGAAGGTAGGATAAGTAGVGAGEGLLGGANLSTLGGLSGGSIALPAATSGALTSPSILAGTGSELTGAGMLNAGQVTPNLLSGAGMTTASGQIASGATPLTTMDRFGNYLSNMPTNAMDWAKNNPVSAGKMALDVATPAPQQPVQPASGVQPIQRGNYDPSSTLLNVSPNMGTSKEELARSKAGMFANAAHLTDADRRKIDDFYNSYIG